MAETIIVLGQYSLLAYIVHIAVLQVLARSMRVWTWADHGTVLPLAVTVALTVLAVNAARWARARSHLLDRLYRMMFA